MIINSQEEMQKFAKELFDKWHKRILLYWDLWAWKTQFTQWFANKLGIEEFEIQSPTYTYMNEYQSKLLHIDMYRIEEIQELIEKWIIDKIEEYEYICIEWPKFEDSYIDDDFLKIQINKLDETKREIIF